MDKKKKAISGWYEGIAIVVFVSAVMSAVYGSEISNYTWLYVAFWEFVCGGLLLRVSHFIKRADRFAGCCDYKDGIINGLYEQRNQLYEKIARLTDECNELLGQLKVGEGKADESAEETIVGMEPDECQKVIAPACAEVDKVMSPNLLSADPMEISITVTPDKVLPSMDANLYIQPKDEFSRWWKIRGYDTELSKPNKEYYIYIRLAHKGFDGELRFLSKSRLVQNEMHRFIQVGTISPVTDGRRTVSYSLDGFRFKQIKKGKK